MDRIYEGTKGLNITIGISGLEDFSKLTNPVFKVLTPIGIEEEWECSIVSQTQSLMHILDNTYELIAGTYFIQPWFHYESWYGPWAPIRLTVYKKFT